MAAAFKESGRLAQQYAKEYGEQLATGDVSEKELARIMCEDHPSVFHSVSQARMALRYHLGKREGRPGTRCTDPVDITQTEPPPNPKTNQRPSDLQGRLLSFLKRRGQVNQRPATHSEISDALDIGISRVPELLAELKDGAFNVAEDDTGVFLSKEIPRRDPTIVDVAKESKNYFKFGVVGDNHLGSKYERLDILHGLYRIFEQEGVEQVYNTGNFVDGDARFNKHDLIVHGIEAQLEYFLRNYPDNMKTSFITGDDHEGWWTQREGIDVGQYLQSKAHARGMTHLEYLGHMEHDIHLKAKNGETIIRVLHPGGGSSYATSYSVQKIVESYHTGEKPHVLLVGHYHKADYNFIRGVHTVQSGCTQDQTPFMRKKKLAAHLGGWIIEMWTDEVGCITRFRQEYLPFQTRDFYDNKWKYHWSPPQTKI